ncbi:MAG: SGNH/GDSL hydrolase family protein [Gemmatimonadota bacterium]|nr:SGNH/GDSL hydrolase family protein [Gemmatimonadota bacterium]
MTWRELLRRLFGQPSRPLPPPTPPPPAPVPPPVDPPPTGRLVGLVARGDSMAAGSGIGNPLTADPADTWLRELGKHLGVQVYNAGVGGTLVSQAVAAQERDGRQESIGWHLLIFTGHNDVNKGDRAGIVPGIRTLAGNAGAGGYTVLGLTTGLTGEKGSEYYSVVCAPGGINSQLEAEHGPRFFNTHRFMVDEAMGMLGLTATAQDRADIAADIPPDSLRADAGRGHFNERGQQALADRLATRF